MIWWFSWRVLVVIHEFINAFSMGLLFYTTCSGKMDGRIFSLDSKFYEFIWKTNFQSLIKLFSLKLPLVKLQYSWYLMPFLWLPCWLPLSNFCTLSNFWPTIIYWNGLKRKKQLSQSEVWRVKKIDPLLLVGRKPTPGSVSDVRHMQLAIPQT